MKNLKSAFALLFVIIIVITNSCKKEKTPEPTSTPTTPAVNGTVTPYNIGTDAGLTVSIDNQDRILFGTANTGIRVFDNGTTTTYTWSGSTSDIVRSSFLDGQGNICFVTDKSMNSPFNLIKFNGSGTNTILTTTSGPFRSDGNSNGVYYYSSSPNEILAFDGTTTTTYTHNLSTTISGFYEVVVDNNNVVWYNALLPNQPSSTTILCNLNNGVFTAMNFRAERLVFDSNNGLWGAEFSSTDTLINYSNSVVTKYDLASKVGDSDFKIYRNFAKNNKIFIYGGTGSPNYKNYLVIYDQTNLSWKSINISSIISNAGFEQFIQTAVIDSNENIWVVIQSGTNKLLKISNY